MSLLASYYEYTKFQAEKKFKDLYKIASIAEREAGINTNTDS